MKAMKITSLIMGLALGTTIVLPAVGRTTAEATVTYPNKIDENASVARRIAEEGTVLLKNDGVLPLQRSDRIAGLGVGQDVAQVFGGGGSGWVNATETVNYRDGLRNAAAEGYITSYSPVGSPTTAGTFNKAIYYILRSPTEGADLTTTDYYLNQVEINDITQLIARFGKENVIVVLNVGSVIDTTWLIEQDVGAIVLAYLGGEQAGNALASVLTGQTSPSGKLVDTWAKRYEDYPTATESGIGTFAGDANTYYTEDVYVGYRYFATFDPDYEKVNYEFGYGLSYTEFSFSDYSVTLEDDTFTVNVRVTNTGTEYSGKEVVQVYFGAPQGKMGAPAAELAGFAKTDLLAPGQSQTVSISFDRSELARYDDTGKIAINSWVIEAGEYPFYIGNSIKNAVQGGARYTYTASDDEVLETTTQLRATTLASRLLSDGSYETLSGSGELTPTHNVSAAGATLIQAEDYASMTGRGTSEIYYIGTDGGFGLGNLNTAGNTVTYDLHVEKEGTYRIAFNMASAWDGQRDMFELYVNNVPQDITVNMDATHTDSDNRWFACEYLTSGSYLIDLPQGDVTLRFESTNTCFMNFDSFVIFNQDVATDSQTIIQAENFTSSTLGTEMIADGTATARSNAAGNTYEYTLNVTEPGTYYLSLRASNVTAAQRDVLSVSVNGTAQEVSVDLMRTAASGDVLESNYHVFTDTNAVPIVLPAGEVTLRLETNNAAVCCIDTLTLTPSALWTEQEDTFTDNTDAFVYLSDTSGTEQETLITYDDVYADPSLLSDFLSQFSVEELVRLLGVDSAQNTIGTGTGGVGGMYIDSKYGIPSAYTSDGPAGIRYGADNSLYATWFPCMTMLASTWNLDLAKEFGSGVAQEAVLGGVNVWLAPGVNIHRNPLCGRNFEYFSEDPLLSGLFGAEITRSVQNYGVSVCVKHYCANNQETNRFGNNSCVSIRALREIYLKSFEIVVKKGEPMSIMSSYNRVNGLHVASSYDLITNVLRTEWGFDGAVFSDWTPHASHISLVQSGNTFKSYTPEYETLIQAYKSGALTREELERNAADAISFLMMSNAGGQQVTLISETGTTYLTEENRTRTTLTENGSIDFYRISVSKAGYYELDLRYSVGEVSMRTGGIDLTSSDPVWLDEGIYEFAVDLGENEAFGTIALTVHYDAEPSEPVTPTPPDDDPGEEGEDEQEDGQDDGSSEEPQGLTPGAIAGICIACVAVVGGGVTAIVLLRKKRSKN